MAIIVVRHTTADEIHTGHRLGGLAARSDDECAVAAIAEVEDTFRTALDIVDFRTPSVTDSRSQQKTEEREPNEFGHTSSYSRLE
jgi:hypothetical protein